MERRECIEILYPELEDRLVLTVVEACAQELYGPGDRANFFYLQHAMGLASSIGLGLAMHRPNEHVVVLDHDGSALMNLDQLPATRALVVAAPLRIVDGSGSPLRVVAFIEG